MNQQQSPLIIGDALIRMDQVVKVFKTASGDFPALKGVSASFQPGQFVSVMGKSGSGKSTLLNMLTGIDHPSSGEITISGVRLNGMTESTFSVWRGRNLGIVFQFFQLLPTLSLLENTMLPMDFCGLYDPADREPRAMELLKMVGLQDFAHKPPAAVSSGQEQCAAIARALANDPPIIVADEPTGNLDSRTAEMVLAIIDGLVEKGKTVLVVTHDAAVARRASRVLVLSDGELVNELVPQVFPQLSHRSMLALSHKFRAVKIEPGTTIFPGGMIDLGLALVTSGEAELTLAAGRSRGSGGLVLKPGNIMSQYDLEQFGSPFKSFLAAKSAPLEALVVEKKDLEELLGNALDLQQALLLAAQKHLEIARRSGKSAGRDA